MNGCTMVWDSKEKERAYNARRYVENKEMILARNARWTAANPDKVKAISKRYHATPSWREISRAKCARYAATHAVQIAAQRKGYRAEHVEEIRAREAQYRHSHRCNSSTITYHQQKRDNGGTFSSAAWLHVKSLFGQCCAYCGKRVKLTQDHVVPVSKGGWHFSGNIVPACKSCNSRKGNRVV